MPLLKERTPQVEEADRELLEERQSLLKQVADSEKAGKELNKLEKQIDQLLEKQKQLPDQYLDLLPQLDAAKNKSHEAVTATRQLREKIPQWLAEEKENCMDEKRGLLQKQELIFHQLEFHPENKESLKKLQTIEDQLDKLNDKFNRLCELSVEKAWPQPTDI